jgi:hypothetical protein
VASERWLLHRFPACLYIVFVGLCLVPIHGCKDFVADVTNGQRTGTWPTTRPALQKVCILPTWKEITHLVRIKCKASTPPGLCLDKMLQLVGRHLCTCIRFDCCSGLGPVRRSAGPACLWFSVQAGADFRVGKSADPNRYGAHLRNRKPSRGIYPTILGTCYVGRIILETMALEECLHVASSVLFHVSHPRPLLVGLWPV